jgi:hypothetical protein
VAVLDLLQSVKQYFRWRVIVLIALTGITFLSPVRIIEILLSLVTLTLAYIFCGNMIYKFVADLNFTTPLFDEDAEQTYRYLATPYLIFAGSFWIGYYLIFFFLNLRTFLTNLVGDSPNINQTIIIIGLASIGLQALSVWLSSKRRRLGEHRGM